jgi:hypothetical protein
LLCWYKSTNTDSISHAQVEAGRLAAEIEKKNQLAERLAAEKLAKAAAAEKAAGTQVYVLYLLY